MGRFINLQEGVHKTPLGCVSNPELFRQNIVLLPAQRLQFTSQLFYLPLSILYLSLTIRTAYLSTCDFTGKTKHNL